MLSAQLAHVLGILDATWKTATGTSDHGGDMAKLVTKGDPKRSVLRFGHSTKLTRHQHWANQWANPTGTDPTCATHDPDS